MRIRVAVLIVLGLWSVSCAARQAPAQKSVPGAYPLCQECVQQIENVCWVRLHGKQDVGVLVAAARLALTIGKPMFVERVRQLYHNPKELEKMGIDDKEDQKFFWNVVSRELAEFEKRHQTPR